MQWQGTGGKLKNSCRKSNIKTEIQTSQLHKNSHQVTNHETKEKYKTTDTPNCDQKPQQAFGDTTPSPPLPMHTHTIYTDGCIAPGIRNLKLRNLQRKKQPTTTTKQGRNSVTQRY